MWERFRSFLTVSRLPLEKRVFLGFALLIGLVSLMYSFALVRTIEYVESLLVGDIMREKITLMEVELSLGRVPMQTDEIHLYGDAAGLSPVPEVFSDAPLGYSESVGVESAFLYKRTTDDGRILMLVFDQTAFEAEEQVFQRIVALSFFVVVLVAGFFGLWLGRRVVDPIRTLSAKVSALAQAPDYRPLSIDFADDEVGRLAKACNRALGRLFEAIERERTFTSDVSHELRAPLTVIRTSAECLELGDLNDRQREHLTRILRVVDEMNNLLDVFLAFARESQMSHDMTDEVTTVLEKMVEVWEPVARKKGLTFEFISEGKTPGAYSPVLLGVVAMNLVKNAVHYTETGGVTITETDTGFRVADTGLGIAPEERERIFEKFFRGLASANRPGAGVGLSVVKRIADRCGWRVKVESSEAGTCFTVTLRGGPKQKRLDERSSE